MFRTGTGGRIDFTQIPERMLIFFNRMQPYGSDFEILIGTDSQNHSQTRIVNVICIICHGHGGIYFYEVTDEPIIRDVKRKLQVETNGSLVIASRLVGLLESVKAYEEMYLTCPIAIHVDAGNSPKGKTRELIPQIVGWVRACGYDVKVKPESFCASTIADRITK